MDDHHEQTKLGFGPYQLHPGPYVVHVTISFTRGNSLLAGRLSNGVSMCFKINCLDVDKWLNIEAHWSCHFTFQENLPRGMFWLDHIVSMSKSVADK